MVATPDTIRVPAGSFHEAVVVTVDVTIEGAGAVATEWTGPGTVVTIDLLRERRLVPASAERVKVLARGDISKGLTVRAHKFSEEAAKKIAAAGGAAETL